MFSRMYAEIRRKLAHELNRAQTVADIERAANSVTIEDEVEQAFERVYEQTGVAFAKIELNRLKGRDPLMELKEDEDFLVSAWLEKMREYVKTKCGTKIARSIQTAYADIKKNVRKAVALGAENGWGAQRVANEIMSLQGKMDGWKAMRIARTEVVGASNVGAQAGADDAGIPLDKVWLATPSGDSREDHLAMDGEIAVNGMFTLPSGVQMEYPHDPNAPAEEVINCRCALSHVPKDNIIDQILQGDGI